MAVNKVAWVANLNGAPGPLKFKGKFQAGATQAIKRGELLKLSGGYFVPMATDVAMSAIVAVADCEIQSGDLEGYYDLIVPRPADLFEFALAAAAAPSPGASLYVSDSQTLTTTAGTNVVGNVADETLLPKQGFKSRDISPDAGTTILTRSQVRCTIKAAASYFAALQT